jgi:hypothetical protein
MELYITNSFQRVKLWTDILFRWSAAETASGALETGFSTTTVLPLTLLCLCMNFWPKTERPSFHTFLSLSPPPNLAPCDFSFFFQSIKLSTPTILPILFLSYVCLWRILIFSCLSPTLLSFRIGAGIAHWYSAGLRAGWSGVRVPAGAGNFSLHHRVQTGSWDHADSYPIGIRGSFPGLEAEHSPPSSAEVKNVGDISPFLQYARPQGVVLA